jgi:hypothetical protein
MGPLIIRDMQFSLLPPRVLRPATVSLPISRSRPPPKPAELPAIEHPLLRSFAVHPPARSFSPRFNFPRETGLHEDPSIPSAYSAHRARLRKSEPPPPGKYRDSALPRETPLNGFVISQDDHEDVPAPSQPSSPTARAPRPDTLSSPTSAFRSPCEGVSPLQ